MIIMAIFSQLTILLEIILLPIPGILEIGEIHLAN